MRTMIVTVLDVLGKDLRQMPLVEDHYLVEHFTAERSDHPLAERVRPRSLWRSLDDPDAAGPEDLIEDGDEQGVPVTDQQPQRIHPRAQFDRQVPGPLSHSCPGRAGSDLRCHADGVERQGVRDDDRLGLIVRFWNNRRFGNEGWFVRHERHLRLREHRRFHATDAGPRAGFEWAGLEWAG